jgi:hypothetical protein
MVLIILGAVDVGRAVLVQHSLEEAARAGCRLYAFKDLTQQDAQEIIDECMSRAGIEGYEVEFDPPAKSDVDQHMEPVTVTVTVGNDKVALVPSGFMLGKTMAGRCTMPADLNQIVNEQTGGGSPEPTP